jgi:hypothetical protein
MRISVIAAQGAARQPVSPVPHPSPSCYYPAVPDRRFYSLRSKKSCRCQHGISAHHSKKTQQGRTDPCWFPGCRGDDSCLGQRQRNRIFKNYLALPNEAGLERGDKAIPMRPKKSANGVKWTPVVDSQPEVHAW